MTRPKRKILAGSKQEWIDIGRKLKKIRCDMSEISSETEKYLPKASLRYFRIADMAIGILKEKLEDIVHHRYPDWKDASKVFYGPLERSMELEGFMESEEDEL
jgi:ATP-dependent helicase YprA (DUF1998 family)